MTFIPQVRGAEPREYLWRQRNETRALDSLFCVRFSGLGGGCLGDGLFQEIVHEGLDVASYFLIFGQDREDVHKFFSEVPQPPFRERGVIKT